MKEASSAIVFQFKRYMAISILSYYKDVIIALDSTIVRKVSNFSM